MHVAATFHAHTHTHVHAVTKDEVEKLLYLYHRLTPDRLDRVRFRDLLHIHFSMSDDFFMDRVFRAFDKESGGFLTQEDWVRGMSIFLKGTLDEKIKCNQKIIHVWHTNPIAISYHIKEIFLLQGMGGGLLC